MLEAMQHSTLRKDSLAGRLTGLRRHALPVLAWQAAPTS